MKSFFSSFGIFIRQIIRDYMLIAICLVPLLIAFLFHFGVPYLETLLCTNFERQTILSEYYLLFDLVLCFIPSFMICFASAMVMLTERDENMGVYMAVTPVGKMGYMISRLIVPSAISVPFSILITYIFSLTVWNFLTLLGVSIFMSLLSTIIALFIFSFSRNRVEGMAMAKMSGLVIIGFVVPFFILSDIQYLVAFLPSFWVAKFSMESSSLIMFFAAVVSFAWIWVLGYRFQKKFH